MKICIISTLESRHLSTSLFSDRESPHIRACSPSEAYVGKLMCNFNLLFGGKRNSWCLFTISQGGVENIDPFWCFSIGAEESDLPLVQ